MRSLSGVMSLTAVPAMAEQPEFTSEELQRLAFAALEAGDVEVVERALTYMAVYYPDDAQAIKDAALWARSLRDAEHVANGGRS